MEPLISKPRQRKINGFSFIEMMTVLALIAILSALSVSGFSHVTGAAALTATGDHVVGLLTGAQQDAIAKNAHIELRLYQPAGDSVERHWSIVPVREKADSSYEAVAPPYHFPGDIVISRFPVLSTLVSQLKPGTDDGTVIRSSDKKTSFTYTSFRFNPDGSTDLPRNAEGDTWHLSLIKAGDAGQETDSIPKNFYTIRIDPYTGAVRTYRP